MFNTLKKREVDALAEIDIESRFLQDDFVAAEELAAGIEEGMLMHLLNLGLLEAGRSDRYPDGVGYRLTLDGERCLHSKTWAEIVAGDKPNAALKAKRWPPKG